MPDLEYARGEISVAEGDAILAYSDGVTDAQNAAGEPFGEPRLRALWSELCGASPAVATETIFARLGAYRGSAAQNDDITVLVVGTDE